MATMVVIIIRLRMLVKHTQTSTCELVTIGYGVLCNSPPSLRFSLMGEKK